MSDDDADQRVPVTISDDYRAEVFDEETCDGADGFDCGKTLVRGQDEINVTNFGPGHSRSGRRVLCSECREKQNAVQIAETPDLAAVYDDEELADLRERFPGVLEGVEFEVSR